MPIRVLVVDDSAVMRGMLTEVINQQPDMKVVGVANSSQTEHSRSPYSVIVTLAAFPGMRRSP